MRNINRMLAWAHGTAIEELLTKRPGCPRVVVDQFAPTEATILKALKPLGKKAEVVQRHKAESDIAVAAASVIAREIFLRDVAKMSEEIFGPESPAEGEEKRTVPIGSSDPKVRALAEEMVRKEGPVWLMNHAKAHFQTTDKVLGACGHSRDDLPEEGRVTSAVANGDFKNTFRKSKKQE
jgi:ribonuclease HIII